MDLSPDTISSPVPESIDSTDDGKSKETIIENTEFTFDFSEKTWKEDLTLIVEGKELFVAKNVLALASSVFEKMFESDFKEKSTDKLELPGKNYADVLEFLRCFYPSVMKQVNGKTVSQILPLADEYQIQFLKDNCEAFLLENTNDTTSTDDLSKCLRQACLYSFIEVKQKCVLLLAERSIDDLEDADGNITIPLEVTYDLLKIINEKRRNELEEARQLKEAYERKNEINKYLLSGLNKSNKSKLKQFGDAHGAYTKLAFKVRYSGTAVLATSSTVNCNSLQWVVKTESSYFRQIGVKLCCTSEAIRSPFQVTGRIVFINMFDSKEDLSECFDHTFNVGSREKNVQISLDNLTTEHAGFSINGNVQMEVVFLVKERDD